MVTVHYCKKVVDIKMNNCITQVIYEVINLVLVYIQGSPQNFFKAVKQDDTVLP
jgi:hypothetical protein